MMEQKKLNIKTLTEIFNKIAMEEGFKIAKSFDPLQYFSSRDSFFKLIDRMIDYYVELEEYEKCAVLVKVKKEHGWKEPKVIEKKVQ